MRYPFWERGSEAWELPEAFETVLADARRDGHAAVEIRGRFKTAAPALRGGEMRASISLSAPAAMLSEQQRHACARDVRAAAERPSREQQVRHTAVTKPRRQSLPAP